MFPFQPSQQDLGFGNPRNCEKYQIHDGFSENNLINFSTGSKESKKKDLELCGKESSSKKVMHREVERKRRQEMSNLYASLRSLLPHQQIVGKRSVCDQIEVAESHIKGMEKNIQELKTRRNKLKSGNANEIDYNNKNNNVTINIVSDGKEILISHSIKGSDLWLSRILAELHRNDVDVVSSVSTRMKERFVHKIQVKAVDMENPAGALVLQERLRKAIN